MSDINRLRSELAARLRLHPPSTWPPELLTLTALAIDLKFGAPPADAERPRRLQVVR